ncbi:MAG: multicopper oxidase domain-containing protein [Alphaproteobacteria bacterium]|nr:multicopper oxidase domain-containing protein [Alphaproteobacteria bacterium]
MFLGREVSRRRFLEAENARRNRLEIVKAISHGQVTRRDLFRWGIFTGAGMLALKNGLSPYASSAFASDVPTGTPRSPVRGVAKFSIPMPRPNIPQPTPMRRVAGSDDYEFVVQGGTNERPAKRLSYHDAFTRDPLNLDLINPVTGRGPIEGRPPGEFFAHQRWNDEDISPVQGYVLSLGQVAPGSRYHPDLPVQDKNSVWAFGTRPMGRPGTPADAGGLQLGSIVPPLIRMRYYEPVVTRIYNDLPVDRTQNNGFGRNEISTHFHNAHNGAESDGACNAYHFPGTFYDYHWSAACARRDLPEVWPTDVPDWERRCSGPRDDGGLDLVPGDFRELQGSMWFHDHRFFFTAENVHKHNFALVNMYSGPDRGNERLKDGINLRLPSGDLRPEGWGNVDFDVNLCISNPALDPQGQLFFDIFDTDGFLGDILAVNGAYYPYMEVLPRRYRFRTLNASMSRFIQLTLAVNQSSKFAQGTKVPVYFIANDGNFLVSPVKVADMDVQGVAERFDFIVDFSAFQPGDTIHLVNRLRQVDGRRPDEALAVRRAMLRGDDDDPAVGSIMEFKVVPTLKSVDDPTYTYDYATHVDRSTDVGNAAWRRGDKTLTYQIPIVEPVRVREIEFNRGGGDSRDTPDGQCVPECGEHESFPWTIKINGEEAHSLNANRISALIPRPGEVEHWVLVNGGGGWDHPIHLHFEEAVTIGREGDPIAPTELLARKDVWRLGSEGERTVRIQVRFGEFGGAYVAHCHNTTHEDFAMLMRYQLLTPPPGDPAYTGQPQWVPTLTPIPTPDGVIWKEPEILDEGDPRRRDFAER